VEDAIFQLRLATMNKQMAVIIEGAQLEAATLRTREPVIKYFGDRLGCTELVQELRTKEVSFIEFRIAMNRLELAMLEEELPHARRRVQIAESDKHLEFDRQLRFCRSHANSDTASVATSTVDSDSDAETVETTPPATPTLVTNRHLAHGLEFDEDSDKGVGETYEELSLDCLSVPLNPSYRPCRCTSL
jgi:hypothetical protein